MSAGLLICPVCAAPLELGANAARCPAGHSFDRASDGYVNLLLARGARAAARGDTAAMLRARRDFLEAGHYLPLVEAMLAAWEPHPPARSASTLPTAQEGTTTADPPCACEASTATEEPPCAGRGPRPSGRGAAGQPSAPVLLDAGCGEGWWLRTLGERLAAAGRPHQLAGLDISREAARMTARRSPGAVVLVVDVARRLPLADGAVDLLLNVFAPRNPAEFARVLAPGGRLLTVIPAPGHLAELRAAAPLLGIEPDKEAETIARLTAAGLRCAARRDVAFPMHLGPAELGALVAMSPSAFHLTEEQRAAMAALPSMAVTAACVLLTFVREERSRQRGGQVVN